VTASFNLGVVEKLVVSVAQDCKWSPNVSLSKLTAWVRIHGAITQIFAGYYDSNVALIDSIISSASATILCISS
jgi:hypothetical protein